MMRLILIIFIFLISCNGSQNILNQITNSSHIYMIDDFKNIDLKIAEQYDNSDLPYSESVYWGFWKDEDADVACL